MRHWRRWLILAGLIFLALSNPLFSNKPSFLTPSVQQHLRYAYGWTPTPYMRDFYTGMLGRDYFLHCLGLRFTPTHLLMTPGRGIRQSQRGFAIPYAAIHATNRMLTHDGQTMHVFKTIDVDFALDEQASDLLMSKLQPSRQ